MATPPTDPTLVDPLFRELRQRHPEVDVVLLPQPAPVPAPELTLVQRDALAADLERSLDELLDRLATDPSSGPSFGPVRRDASWHTDEWHQTWLECVAVVGPLDEGANIALLRATGEALVGLGWQARPVPGDRPRLEARRRGGLDGVATVRPESLVLTFRTIKMVAADEVAS